MKRLSALVRPEDFFSEAHRRMYEACLAIYEAGQPIDPVTVANWLKDRDRLAQVGGMAYLTEVLNSAPSVGGLAKYARIVRDKARVRRTILAAQRAVAEGYAGGGEDSAYLARTYSSMADATRYAEAETLRGNADALGDIVKRIHRAATIGSIVTGIRTGLTDYDNFTLGLHAKQLTVVAARPGDGKTSLGTNIGSNVARDGIGVLMFSLEMGREEILERQLSGLSRIDGTLLKTGRLTPDQWSRLHDAAQTSSTIPFWIEDRTGLTMQNIREIALGAIDESANRKTALGVIVVDYLQKIKIADADRRKQRYEQVGDMAKGLKQLARDTGMPVIALAQLKRVGKLDKVKRPTMDDLRESGDIEQEADNIVLIHRNDEAGMENVRELLIEKARGGRTGIVRCAWRPELTLFEDSRDPY